MLKSKYTRYLTLLLIVIGVLSILLVMFYPETAEARPGGGHSYRGGGGGGGGSRGYSGGGGSSSSSDGDGIITLIFFILLELPPEISIPLVIIFLVFYFFSKNKSSVQAKKLVSSAPTYENRQKELEYAEISIERLKEEDANFSKIMFLDFVASLYNRYYALIGKPEFKNIIPFLSEELIQKGQDSKYKNTEISEIVVGSLSVVSQKVTADKIYFTVEINSNYTQSNVATKMRYINTERWMMERSKGVKSQPPDRMRGLNCPSCGAPNSYLDAGTCTSCGTALISGKLQWMVTKTKLVEQYEYKTTGLGTYTEEVGTNYPTIVQKDINEKMKIFVTANRHADWNAFWDIFQHNVLEPYFMTIYQAWSDVKWENARHLVTDRLYESYQFWMSGYKRESLINKLDKINIDKIELSRIDLDKYYESITVRIFASCYDYTVNKQGKVIGGSNKTARYFSEYWTFIHRAGTDVKETMGFDLKTCPNCGAPADKMGQAAECGYCNSKISNGDFSWVLAVITQDEVYEG